MNLSGIQKLTLLDYPGKTAATVFTPGCGLRCPFCQNRDLVTPEDGYPLIDTEELFDLLARRHGLLDAVCISGGEPLLQPDITEFCERIHAEGFLVKIDTNGTRPGTLRGLIEASLVDYVAMDVKNRPERYPETVGIPNFDVRPVRQSIDLLMEGRVDYEFRTTVVRELHSPADLHALAEWVIGARAWYLQSFIDSETVLAGKGKLHAYTHEELEVILADVQRVIPTAQLRRA